MEFARKRTGAAIRSRRSGIGWEVGFATAIAGSSLVTYWLITHVLRHEALLSRDDNLLGGMWAVVATVFVFRRSFLESARVALSRTLATLFSGTLCFLYLLFFPFHVVGMIILIWISSVILPLIGRSEEVITAGITTAVVLVVAGLSSGPTWIQPILRLVDTTVGVAIGLLASWIVTVAGLTPVVQYTDL